MIGILVAIVAVCLPILGILIWICRRAGFLFAWSPPNWEHEDRAQNDDEIPDTAHIESN
jgi:hypothetical protein